VRAVLLVVALVFIAGLAALTIDAAASGGVDVLTIVSLLVIALFAFGIVGALLRPPDE
jgi:hypothetical protein